MLPTPHPALKNVPKTPLEAIQRIRKSFVAGDLQEQGNCSYQDTSGKPCAIGSLFTSKQREYLQQLGLNGQSISGSKLKNQIGKDNLEVMTGMPLDLCQKVQNLFDMSIDKSGVNSFLYRLDEMYFIESKVR